MEAQLNFRQAASADVADVVQLVESAYRGEASRRGWTTEADLLSGQRTDAASVSAVIANPLAHVLLAELDDKLVGCCLVERRPQATAYFGMFAVRPELQSSGVGGSLLNEAERIAREEWQSIKMRLTVIRQREALIAWYVRRGFVVTGETEPFPLHDVRFGIPLRDDLEFLVLVKDFS